MQNSGEQDYQAWFLKAEEDEFSGERILSGKRFAAPACFHFQQMAEKLLKALFVCHRKEFPRVHDLVALAAMVKSFAPDIENYKEDIKFLDRYYTETRYPGDYPEFTHSECRGAYEAALRIKAFVLEQVAKAGKEK